MDSSILTWLAGCCVVAALLGCVYTLLATGLVIWFGRPRRVGPSTEVPVTLLKPLCGDEPGLYDRLRRFCFQDYAAPVQIVFGVRDHSDRAIGEVERLKAECPTADFDIRIDSRQHGRNRKVSNLINMAPLARHSVLVLSDSDIEVRPDYLKRIMDKLQAPGVGAVTCIYHGVPGTPSLWSRLAALSINLHLMPNAILATTLGIAHPCFGSTIAIRRRTLDKIGGFLVLADYLADDYKLGEAVRDLGQKVVVASGSVGHVCVHDSAIALLEHRLRSARTIRTISPAGYAGSIITNPLPLAALGVVGGAYDGIVAVIAAIICRYVLCLVVERACGLPRQPYWLVPICDFAEFVVHLSSIFTGTVRWKGFRYQVMSDGRLVRTVRPTHRRWV